MFRALWRLAGYPDVTAKVTATAESSVNEPVKKSPLDDLTIEIPVAKTEVEVATVSMESPKVGPVKRKSSPTSTNSALSALSSSPKRVKSDVGNEQQESEPKAITPTDATSTPKSPVVAAPRTPTPTFTLDEFCGSVVTHADAVGNTSEPEAGLEIPQFTRSARSR